MNQHALGTVPNMNAAFFRFYNEEANPVGRLISFIDSTEFDPGNLVELAPGEDAFVFTAGLVLISDNCEKQFARPVIDFDSPECQVPEDADPETTLQAIQTLPSQCLGPQVDACELFDEMGFASSITKAKEILGEEEPRFVLDGAELSSIENFKLIKVVVSSSPTSQPSPIFDCTQELRYTPISAYFSNGFSIPSPKGKCVSNGFAAPVTPLDPGLHNLEINFDSSDGQESFHIPIFQNAP